MVEAMDKAKQIKRMTRNAIMLALLCIIGMFSIPLGTNIKVSLQLLMVFIIIPVYAGFNAGVSPTFGFVISFVVLSFPLYFLNKLPIKNQFIRMGIACLVSLLICYIIGSIFLMLYLKLSIEKALLISVVPYIPFDIAKIIIATLVVSVLPKEKLKI